MKKFKKAMAIMLIFSLLFAVTACSGGGEETSGSSEAGGDVKVEQTFTLAMDSAEDTVTYLFGEKFSELVSEKTDGRIKIDVYANASLGSDKEITEGIQAGNVDFVVQTTAPQVNFVPEVAVFDIPHLFKDLETARTVLDSPFFDTIAQKYEDAGIKLLAYSDQGFRVMTSNKKVEKVKDLSGVKIRTMENPYHIEYWKSVGANPTPMTWGEVYTGLQQGTIDAQENPYEAFVASKIQEQQKYVIHTNHILHILSLTTNPNTFNSLSEEDQNTILEAAKEAKQWSREQADARLEERQKICEDAGLEITDLDPAVIDELSQKASSVEKSIRKAVGDELVDSLLSEVEKAQ